MAVLDGLKLPRTLYGRQPDLDYLLDRVSRPGVTFVVGRPMQGKTWVLRELSLRLLQDHGYLVGYHECVETEGLFLRAAADLYGRWLGDANYYEQAKMVWEQQSAKGVAGFGVGFGKILAALGALGGTAHAAASKAAAEALYGLNQANRDLTTGGLLLAPLDHDQVRDVLRQVQEIAKPAHPLVLVLDAWEKTRALDSEKRILGAYLSHLSEGDWPPVHFVCGIRHPDDAEPETGAYLAARQLHKERGQLADTFDLPAMTLTDDMLAGIRAGLAVVAPAVASVPTDQLRSLLGGYPGVLDRLWTHAGATTGMAELASIAEDAQEARYPEFERLFAKLEPVEHAVAMRLAMLPQLGDESWPRLRLAALGDAQDATWHALVQRGVLEDGERDVPSYGHDTRHAAAWRYLAAEQGLGPTLRHCASELVLDLAGLTGPSLGAAIAVPALAVQAVAGRFAPAALAPDAQLASDCVKCLVAGKRPALNGASARAQAEPRLTNLVAAATLASAIGMGDEGDRKGELANYTVVIDMANSSAELRAVALFNRGMTKGQLDDADGEVADYTALIEMPDASAEHRANALVNRAVARGRRGDTDGEIADYASVIGLLGAPAEAQAIALVNRGLMRSMEEDTKGAMEDWTAAADMPSAPAEQRAKALANRGMIYRQMGDLDRALSDFTAAVDLPGSPVDQVAMALACRGMTRGILDDIEGASADIAAAVETNALPSELSALLGTLLADSPLQPTAAAPPPSDS